MNYDIAIIIPTLNEEKFISRCINSILKQSFDFEKMDVMVVDGGSTDKTVEIVKSYQKLYKNIRLLENKKKIQSVAFNIGISNSDAPYIIRFDAHTTYDKEYISLCIKVLKEKEEIGNVGAGNSATALSQLINRKIDMTVPQIAIMPLGDVPDVVGGPDAMVAGVFLRVYGPAPSSILFLLPVEVGVTSAATDAYSRSVRGLVSLSQNRSL